MYTRYICTLDKSVQDKIRKALRKVLDNKEDIEDAMSSRLCDLKDIIDIYKVAYGFKRWARDTSKSCIIIERRKEKHGKN